MLVSLMLAAIAVNLWPAFWNRFPIVYDDDSVYLGLPNTLHAAMPQFYPMFIRGMADWQSLPDAILVQGGLTAYVLYIGFASFTPLRAAERLIAALIVSMLTQLPWLVSLLTPDFLGGLGILSVVTLAFREKRNAHDLLLLLIAVIACLVATANIFVILPLAMGLAIARSRWAGLPNGWITPIGLLTLSLLAVVPQVMFTESITGRPALAVGSSARLFNKLVDHDLAQPYLVRACADGDRIACKVEPALRSLKVREEFLWGQPNVPALADRLDAWNDRTGIFQRWSIATLSAYPFQAIGAALQDAGTLSTRWLLSSDARDLIPLAAKDDGVRYRIETLHPLQLRAFMEARQQAGELVAMFPATFYGLTTTLGYAGLLAGLFAGIQRRDRLLSSLCGALLAGIIWSTLIHGGLSLPIPRYHVKVSWLALFATIVWLIRAQQPPESKTAGRQGHPAA